jgi:hypothetical protein
MYLRVIPRQHTTERKYQISPNIIILHENYNIIPHVQYIGNLFTFEK